MERSGYLNVIKDMMYLQYNCYSKSCQAIYLYLQYICIQQKRKKSIHHDIYKNFVGF